MRNLFALTILIALAGSSSTEAYAASPGAPQPHKFGPHVLYGIIASISAKSIVLRKLNGTQIVVDISDALSSDTVGVLYVGRPVALHGDYDAKRVYHVNSITSENGILYGSTPTDE